jgi:hypothetical protein
MSQCSWRSCLTMRKLGCHLCGAQTYQPFEPDRNNQDPVSMSNENDKAQALIALPPQLQSKCSLLSGRLPLEDMTDPPVLKHLLVMVISSSSLLVLASNVFHVQQHLIRVYTCVCKFRVPRNSFQRKTPRTSQCFALIGLKQIAQIV